MTVGGLVILDHRTWSSNIRLQGTWRNGTSLKQGVERPLPGSVQTTASRRLLLAYARIQLFVQLAPSPTYIVAVGRLPSHARVDPAMQKWQLPKKGMIGKPLLAPLPRWVGTTLLGRQGDGRGQDILAELESIGLEGQVK